MPDIFNSRTGYVVVYNRPGGAAIPGRIKISGFEPKAALISGINYDQRTNQQFQYALDNAVYVYVFGDMMGEISVSGIAFPALCGQGGDGLSEIFAFYNGRRASQTEALVNIVVGEESINGFLTGMRTRAIIAADEDAGPIHQWTLMINALPKA